MERKNKFGFLCNPLMGLVKKSANTFFQSITENLVNKVKGYFVGTANLILGLQRKPNLFFLSTVLSC